MCLEGVFYLHLCEYKVIKMVLIAKNMIQTISAEPKGFSHKIRELPCSSLYILEHGYFMKLAYLLGTDNSKIIQTQCFRSISTSKLYHWCIKNFIGTHIF